MYRSADRLYVLSNENPVENRQKHAKLCTLFKNLAAVGLKNNPFFLISRIHEFVLPIEKNTPFFTKMSTSMDVHFDREWQGLGSLLGPKFNG